MIRVWFCHSNKPVAFGIRVFTNSMWSHVAIDVDCMLYESTGMKGVEKKHLQKFLDERKNVVCMEIKDVDETKVRDFLEQQVGKGYDFTAIFAFLMHRDWEKENKWFCSELAASALKAGGYNIKKDSSRITPQDLFKMLMTKASSARV